MVDRVLVVGINGFAGQYLRKELEKCGYDVYGVDLFSKDDHTYAADMLSASETNRIVKELRPSGIFNLSGFASPHLSWEHVINTMHLNVDISVNLALAIKEYCPEARLLVIGSSNQYDVEACKGLPINEEAPIKANDPYSVSKQAQENLLRVIAEKYNLDIMITRSFNHIGPGQKKNFVVSDFASGIADVEKGRAEALTVGNLEPWRDFSDVKDTVRAYRLLYEKGHTGEIYNVGSGQAKQIKWILNKLLSYSTIKIPVNYRQPKTEGTVASRVICDYTKLNQHTGYLPEINIESTLKQVLDYYRNQPINEGKGV